MNTQDVQAMVTAAVAHEKRTNAVRQRLSQALPAAAVGPSQQFLISYAETTPALMDAVWIFVRQHNALPRFQPMFDLMFSYWANPLDVIPDAQGLLGVLDDAYVTKRSLQQINEQMGQAAGVPIVTAGLADENRAMRPMLGEAIAVQLDAFASQGNQSLGGWINQLTQLLSAGTLPFGLPINPGQALNNRWASELQRYEIDRSVDVQMGAMGIV